MKVISGENYFEITLKLPLKQGKLVEKTFKVKITLKNTRKYSENMSKLS